MQNNNITTNPMPGGRLWERMNAQPRRNAPLCQCSLRR